MTFIISNWRIILATTLIAGAFFGGWQTRTWKADADALQANIAAESKRVALQKEVDILTAQGASRESRIIYKTKTIYKEVSSLPPATCINDDGLRFVEIWNKTASQANSNDEQVR